MTAPGSILWLLRHELVLQWRRADSKSWGVALPVLLFAGMHLPALGLVLATLRMSLPAGAALAVASLVEAALVVALLSDVLLGLLDAFYARRDLEWLLTTPVDLRRILVVRMLAVTVKSMVTWALIFGPFANIFAIFGHPGLLAFYPVLMALAGLAVSAGGLLCITMVSWLGQRRTRRIVQGLSVLLAMAFGVGVQARNVIPAGLRDAVWRTMQPADPPGLASWPGQALLGAPIPLAAMLLLALGLGALSARMLARGFLRGLTATDVRPRPTATRDGPIRFHAGLTRVLVSKELRLLRRTPGLWAQAAQSLVLILPAALPLLRTTTATDWRLLAAVPIFAASELARLFAATTLSDDGADLAASAPPPARAITLAKFYAAGLAVAALLAGPMGVLMVWRPATAPAQGAGVVLAVSTALLLVLWHPPEIKRNDLGAVRVTGIGATYTGLVNSVLWAVATGLTVIGSLWAVLPVALDAVLLGLAWLISRPLNRSASAPP